TMDSRLEERIRRETATPDNVPLGGVTLGIRDIMHARRIILVANGDNKADIVKEMLCGPITTDVPASILQLHPDCEFIFDSKAASKIDVNKLRKS
ncbi:MAG: 6-phosphogluconolactonase, partial [Muribaculaceae bacterium]|nr:6-phosphogluconolactonase [Muribaculaceae bacterium]